MDSAAIFECNDYEYDSLQSVRYFNKDSVHWGNRICNVKCGEHWR